jgi:hypothetical protein
MTHDLLNISQDATIGEAAQVMLDNKIMRTASAC